MVIIPGQRLKKPDMVQGINVNVVPNTPKSNPKVMPNQGQVKTKVKPVQGQTKTKKVEQDAGGFLILLLSCIKSS